MAATTKHSWFISETCHVVMLYSAGYIIVSVGMIAFFQAGVPFAWSNALNVHAIVGGAMLCIAARLLKVSAAADVVDLTTDSKSSSNEYIWTVVLFLSAFILVVIACHVSSDLRSRSLIGFVALFLMEIAFSCNRRAINWKFAVAGIFFQLMLGAVLLSCRPAFDLFTRMIHVGAAQVQHILLPGAVNVHLKVVLLTVTWGIVALSLFLSGVVKFVLNLTTSVLNRIFGATIIQTLLMFATGISCNLEAIASLKRYFSVFSESEIHLLVTVALTGSFGHLMPLYVALRFPVEHVVLYNIIAAPAAVIVANISHPSTEPPRSWQDLHLAVSKPELCSDNILMTNSKKSVLSEDNGSDGSCVDVIGRCVLAIARMVVIVVGVSVLIYTVITLIDMVIFKLNMTDICSYAFNPLAAVLGINDRYIEQVSTLFGMKTLLHDVTCYSDIRDSLVFNRLDDRSAVISFFACSGSANINCFVLFTIVLASLRLVPTGILLSLMGRAFIDANVATFLTACTAGTCLALLKVILRSHP